MLQIYFMHVLRRTRTNCPQDLREAAKNPVFFSGPATKALPPPSSLVATKIFPDSNIYFLCSLFKGSRKKTPLVVRQLRGEGGKAGPLKKNFFKSLKGTIVIKLEGGRDLQWRNFVSDFPNERSFL